MIRKFALAALTAAGLLGGVALAPSTASAQPSGDHDRRDRGHFQVLVRHRGHWDVHGTYRDRDDAYRVARQLERRGLHARVERVR